MSGILFIGPGKGETWSDYFIDTVHKLVKGEGKEKALAGLSLRLHAIGELYRDTPEPKFDKYDSRLITSVYNHAESIDKNLELSNYGISPMIAHFFPVLNSFAVVGKLGRYNTGFVLDCFTKDICPTKTLAYTKTNSKKLIKRVAEEIFSFKNKNRKPSYTEKSLRRGLLNIERYTNEREIQASISQGEVIFGGEGTSHNDMIKWMMKSCKNYPNFEPKQYILSHYDFAIDMDPEEGKEKFSEDYQKLMGRVHQVLKEKANAA